MPASRPTRRATAFTLLMPWKWRPAAWISAWIWKTYSLANSPTSPMASNAPSSALNKPWQLPPCHRLHALPIRPHPHGVQRIKSAVFLGGSNDPRLDA